MIYFHFVYFPLDYIRVYTVYCSQVSAYYNQLALVNAGNDKGPSGVEPYSIPDAFHYLQAQVGPVGPRGMPGMYARSL